MRSAGAIGAVCFSMAKAEHYLEVESHFGRVKVAKGRRWTNFGQHKAGVAGLMLAVILAFNPTLASAQSPPKTTAEALQFISESSEKALLAFDHFYELTATQSNDSIFSELSDRNFADLIKALRKGIDQGNFVTPLAFMKLLNFTNSASDFALGNLYDPQVRENPETHDFFYLEIRALEHKAFLKWIETKPETELLLKVIRADHRNPLAWPGLARPFQWPEFPSHLEELKAMERLGIIQNPTEFIELAEALNVYCLKKDLVAKYSKNLTSNLFSRLLKRSTFDAQLFLAGLAIDRQILNSPAAVIDSLYDINIMMGAVEREERLVRQKVSGEISITGTEQTPEFLAKRLPELSAEKKAKRAALQQFNLRYGQSFKALGPSQQETESFNHFTRTNAVGSFINSCRRLLD
ncbi:MAG TPA: hypothetical protein VM432_13100 [Bdellovibrionales bacterium]|nr:hypothetical protein [Bdellovibrionales bacterium]